ncbi:YchJ family protein [Actinocorallia lasiicapitis]
MTTDPGDVCWLGKEDPDFRADYAPDFPPDPRPCPCGLGGGYAACCGRYHRGEPAPTAEALMRSRYTAFAVGDAGYLLHTWHPATRPDTVELDPATEWTGLEILSTAKGAVGDPKGTVRFRARYRERGRGHAPEEHVLEEHSRFVHRDGRWLYVMAIEEN